MTTAPPRFLAARPRVHRRDPDESHRASTPLELLFDLCFVVAVSVAAEGLAAQLLAGHPGAALRGYGFAFFAIWWAWMGFTWFASGYDVDDVPYRITTLVQMAGVLVLAAGIGGIFDGHGIPASVVVGYVVLRVAQVAQWGRVAAQDAAARRRALTYAVGVAVVQAGWVALLAVPSHLQLVPYVGLILAELAVPLLAEVGVGRLSWHPGHVVERYGLFTLLVLGESLLAATTAVRAARSADGTTVDLLLVSGGGLLTVFGLWWVYFDQAAGGEDDTPASVRTRSYLWGYGHVVVFACAAAVGAGLELAVELVQEAAGAGAHHAAGIGELGGGLAIAVPVAGFVAVLGVLRGLLGAGGVDLALVARRTVAAGVVLVCGCLAPEWGLPATVVAVGGALAVAIAVDVVVQRRRSTPR